MSRFCVGMQWNGQGFRLVWSGSGWLWDFVSSFLGCLYEGVGLCFVYGFQLVGLGGVWLGLGMRCEPDKVALRGCVLYVLDIEFIFVVWNRGCSG